MQRQCQYSSSSKQRKEREGENEKERQTETQELCFERRVGSAQNIVEQSVAVHCLSPRRRQ